MRTMYDSTTATDIPTSAQGVAGYVDGAYRWSDTDWGRFPDSFKVRIAVFASTNDGHVLDVETGDASPAQAPGWAQRRRLAGVEPSVYVNLSNWDQVRAAFQTAQIAPPSYWLAHWDNVAEVPPGTVAKQYANPDLTGAHYDLSAVADVWPGVDVAGTVFQPPPVGGFLVLSPGLKVGLAHVALSAVYNREPTQQELFDFANTLNADGSNFADLVQGAAGNLVNADLVAISPSHLAQVIAAAAAALSH